MSNALQSKRIAIFYGSTTCYTEIVAEKIKARFESLFSQQNIDFEIDLFNIKTTSLKDTERYNIILFGISTWDFGEIQEDWLSHWGDLNHLDMSGKILALFGLGDQQGYGDWFLDAMGLLYQSLEHQDIHWTGFWPIEGYEFTSQLPIVTGTDYFVGLAIDEDSQYELTDIRIDNWCIQLIDEWRSLAFI